MRVRHSVVVIEAVIGGQKLSFSAHTQMPLAYHLGFVAMVLQVRGQCLVFAAETP